MAAMGCPALLLAGRLPSPGDGSFVNSGKVQLTMEINSFNPRGFGGFLKLGVPLNGCFLLGKIPFKWMFWGYPHFRKPPYGYTILIPIETSTATPNSKTHKLFGHWFFWVLHSAETVPWCPKIFSRHWKGVLFWPNLLVALELFYWADHVHTYLALKKG